jgi:hypothetical protein
MVAWSTSLKDDACLLIHHAESFFKPGSNLGIDVDQAPLDEPTTVLCICSRNIIEMTQ